MPPSRPLSTKDTKIVRQFRGISQYRNIVTVPMDHALNLLNVFISMSGALEKIRLPFSLTDQANFPLGGPQGHIDTFIDFQQANGTRQLVFNAGPCIGFYLAKVNLNGVEVIPYIFNIIDDNVPANNARWSWCQSNNVLYGANGQRMQKWDGAHWYQQGLGQAGISPPAPTTGITIPLSSIQRTGNVVTFTANLTLSNLPGSGNFNSGYQMANMIPNSAITISGVIGDPTMNGTYTIATAPGVGTGTYAQNGANKGPFNNDGFVTIYYTSMAEPTPFTTFDIVGFQRTAGVTKLTIGNTFNPFFAFQVGENITVTGLTGAAATANGKYPLTIITTPAAPAAGFCFNQPGLPDVPFTAYAIGAGPQVSGGLTNVVTGRTWRYAYANSVLGIVGPASTPSTPLPGTGLYTNARAFITAPGTNDPQVDTIWWFATADGGGDYGKILITPIAPNGGLNYLADALDDSLIDFTQLAPLINFAPPIGSKFAKFQGRLFLAGIQNAPQDIAYSAYEQYLVGTRPEEAWFPNNRLRLAVGADDIRGFGVILPGVVAFSHSNQMFMFQGQVEDVTTTLPLNFSATLTELPWATGCTSHQAIQSTPYGIVWVAADLTVKIWNGVFYSTIIGPRDLSENIYPLMRRITPGTAPLIQSAFFNFVERDWFGINLCLDGSITPNYLVFFDLAQSADDNLGVFIANIQADSLGVREDNNGGRHLVISQGGALWELVVESQQTNGIINNQSSTNGQLVAYWQSGFHGSDTPQVTKMYRYGNLIADQSGFGLVATLIDDENYTFVKPLFKALKLDRSKFKVGRKARRCGLTIMFPSQDISASVQELRLSSIQTGERP